MPTEQQIGIFILGVLVGWLIEWIFVRLFMPNPTKKVAATLDAARKENTTLQQQVRDLQAQLAAAKSAVPVPAKAPEPEAIAEPEPKPNVESTKDDPATEPAQAEPEPQLTEKPAPADVDDEGEDELTKLNGIGPKLAEAMQSAGIKRFDQLAVMTTDELSEALASSGIRYSKASAETWAAQAKLAAAGDWQGLKDFTKNG